MLLPNTRISPRESVMQPGADLERESLPAGAGGEEAVGERLAHLDGEETVLVAVVAEDVREPGRRPDPRRDDGAEPGLGDRPDGVLPAGPAAEVLPRDQDAGPLRLRTVQ